MRINPNTANSASKSLPSKPAEHIVSDPAFSFFAQIDQIQNLQDDRDGRPDASSRDKNQDKDGDPNLLPALRAAIPLPSQPFPAPDQAEEPMDSPANELCQSSGDGSSAPNSLFTAVAQSMIGGSSAPMFATQMQNSKGPQAGRQSRPQAFDMSIQLSNSGSPYGLSGRDDGIEAALEPSAPLIEGTEGQNSSPQSLSNGIAQILEKTTDDGQGPLLQLLSNGLARVPAETMDDPGAPAVGRMAGQNPSAQLSDIISRILGKTTDATGATAADDTGRQNPQSLSNGIAQIVEKTADRSGSPAEKNYIAEPGIRSQSDPGKTRASEFRRTGSIPTDPEMRAPFSKIATFPAPDKSGNSVNSQGTAEAPDIQGESYGAPAPIKANAPAAPQNDGGVGSQKDSNPRPNEQSVATTAQSRLNAVQVQPETPLSKTGTNANRQEVFSRTLSTNAPSVDSTLRPASSSAPEPARPQNLIFQIAGRIQIQVRDGGGEIRIQLKPDGLGQLEIKAETTVNGVTARISTDSDGVKSYLDNNLHLLQQTLQDQGLKVDRIFVTVQTGSDDQSSSSYSAQFNHPGQGPHGGESRNPQGELQADGSDVVEEMAVDPATWLMLKPNTRFYTVA
jgi:flagellar hook-length control protein FliK